MYISKIELLVCKSVYEFKNLGRKMTLKYQKKKVKSLCLYRSGIFVPFHYGEKKKISHNRISTTIKWHKSNKGQSVNQTHT